MRIPPTIAGGRALVDSGDGWAYVLEAATGRLLWRFWAAPAERKIPVYGALLSTWPAAERDIAWISNERLACYARGDGRSADRFLKAWGKAKVPGAELIWQAECKPSLAVAVCRNAVVVAKRAELVAFDLQSGKPLWSHALPAAPVP